MIYSAARTMFGRQLPRGKSLDTINTSRGHNWKHGEQSQDKASSVVVASTGFLMFQKQVTNWAKYGDICTKNAQNGIKTVLKPA